MSKPFPQKTILQKLESKHPPRNQISNGTVKQPPSGHPISKARRKLPKSPLKLAKSTPEKKKDTVPYRLARFVNHPTHPLAIHPTPGSVASQPHQLSQLSLVTSGSAYPPWPPTQYCSAPSSASGAPPPASAVSLAPPIASLVSGSLNTSMAL